MDAAVTHTTGEASQNFDLAEGAVPPGVILPFILQPAELPPPGSADLLKSVDTFLVEVSDNREITAGDWILQSNFLTRHLIQKHAAALFPWWKEICSIGVARPETVVAAVEKLRAGDAENLDELEQVLRFTRMTRQSPEETAAGVSELVKRADAKWIFVSHFVVPDDQGTVMEDRRRLVAAIREGASTANAEFFDPSVLIEKHGRATALAGNGADIFEYAEAFNEVVGDAYLEILGREPPSSAASGMLPHVAHDVSAPEEIIELANAELVSIHSRRLTELGRDSSGLFEHYEALVSKGELIPRSDVNRLLHILEFLPEYDRYVVLRAGLGELGFALALAGRKVLAWEPNPARYRAIKEGAALLSERHPEISDNFEVVSGDLRDLEIQPLEFTLGIALSLVILNDGDDEFELAKSAAKTSQLLYSPRHFLRSRPSDLAETQSQDLLANAGYSSFEKLPVPSTSLATKA